MYEYSKLLGNSQFTLLPFQPYKLIYAHMLAEVGRISDSLKYVFILILPRILYEVKGSSNRIFIFLLIFYFNFVFMVLNSIY